MQRKAKETKEEKSVAILEKKTYLINFLQINERNLICCGAD